MPGVKPNRDNSAHVSFPDKVDRLWRNLPIELTRYGVLKQRAEDLIVVGNLYIKGECV
jgi:hypothetical protein